MTSLTTDVQYLLRSLRAGSHRLPAAFLTVFMVAVSGCASLVEQIEPPQVELVGLQLLTTEMNRQSFRVSLDVSNPNPVPVPIDAINYEVALGGGRLAAGKTEEGFTLPANGKERIRLQLSTDLIGTLARLTQLLRGPASTVDYEISGSIAVPLMEPFPFSNSGEVAIAMP